MYKLEENLKAIKNVLDTPHNHKLKMEHKVDKFRLYIDKAGKKILRFFR